jgi:hypothetical protein
MVAKKKSSRSAKGTAIPRRRSDRIRSDLYPQTSINKRQIAACPDGVLQDLPPGRLAAYARLWQFETWLRTMAYVELRARFGDDWAKDITGHGFSIRADTRLTHIPTRERSPLSYITMARLLKLVRSHWHLFKYYLLPSDIWRARIQELMHIRNRTAHFRIGHHDDLARVEQLLRDLDAGFFLFCTSYNFPQTPMPPTRDPIIRKFIKLDPFPWSEAQPNEWIRIGIAPRDLIVGVQIEIERRPWLKAKWPSRVPGKYGYFYNITFTARGQRRFDYPQLLELTRQIHVHVCHIILDQFGHGMTVTMPALLGESTVVAVIETLVRQAERCVYPSVRWELMGGIDAVVQNWPEYVIGPNNPMSFLGPDMPCSFFTV